MFHIYSVKRILPPSLTVQPQKARFMETTLPLHISWSIGYFSIKLYIFERFRLWGFQRCTFCMVNFPCSKIHNVFLRFFAICFTNIFIWVIVKHTALVNLSNKKNIIIKGWKTGQKSTLLSFTAQTLWMDFRRIRINEETLKTNFENWFKILVKHAFPFIGKSFF